MEIYKGYNVTIINDHSYMIEGNQTRIKETNEGVFFFPYPKETVLESAYAHIDAMKETNDLQSEGNIFLYQDLADTKERLIEIQDALIELAELLTGGE